MAKIDYAIRNHSTEKWFHSSELEGERWVGEEHLAALFTDQTIAEHMCDMWRDYSASKGYGWHIVVIERITTDDGTTSHMEVY